MVFLNAVSAVKYVCADSKLYPHSKVHGANMGSIWGRQDPGGPPWTLLSGYSIFSWVQFTMIEAMALELKGCKPQNIFKRSQCDLFDMIHYTDKDFMLNWGGRFVKSIQVDPREYSTNIRMKIDFVFFWLYSRSLNSCFHVNSVSGITACRIQLHNGSFTPLRNSFAW